MPPEQQQRDGARHQEPYPGRLVKEAQQGKSSDSGKTGENVDAVSGQTVRSIFQIPSHQLAEGNKGGRNHGEQWDDHRHGEEDSGPTRGHGGNSPDMDFAAGAEKMRQDRQGAAQRGDGTLQDSGQQQEWGDDRAERKTAPAEITT